MHGTKKPSSTSHRLANSLPIEPSPSTLKTFGASKKASNCHRPSKRKISARKTLRDYLKQIQIGNCHISSFAIVVVFEFYK